MLKLCMLLPTPLVYPLCILVRSALRCACVCCLPCQGWAQQAMLGVVVRISKRVFALLGQAWSIQQYCVLCGSDRSYEVDLVNKRQETGIFLPGHPCNATLWPGRKQAHAQAYAYEDWRNCVYSPAILAW